jgi:dTDP-4-amino-4,6-dideoxygalactose transaminase
VFAQLFGSRVDLAPVAAVARAHDVALIEDAAQAFEPCYQGHPEADLAMFSFGPIKSATALGGAVSTVRDPDLATALRARQDAWPAAGGGEFRRRLAKYLVLASFAHPRVLAWLARRRDLDTLLNQAVRSFRGRDLLAAIRRRPSRALLRLLARRLESVPRAWFERRRQLGDELRAHLHGRVGLVGRPDAVQTHWVLPVLCDNPAELQAHLRGAGFDATRRATLAPLGGDLPRLRRSFDRLLYLPFAPEHRAGDRRRLVEVVHRYGRLPPPGRSAAG